MTSRGGCGGGRPLTLRAACRDHVSVASRETFAWHVEALKPYWREAKRRAREAGQSAHAAVITAVSLSLFKKTSRTSAGLLVARRQNQSLGSSRNQKSSTFREER
ncbi:hypothetical protein NHX12_020930 [Muraenolepis orangiensis]|uniref:Uncharacterized protein n=1 Tax=Muraenolepis orangiensis TaxID=630683 RepID=A0A9Q0EVT2_9TELE|nr:hypothetical protein NHX12_020930 [Muraenolepis orangiensis]